LEKPKQDPPQSPLGFGGKKEIWLPPLDKGRVGEGYFGNFVRIKIAQTRSLALYKLSLPTQAFIWNENG